MGCYVNTDGSKELWLRENATPLPGPPKSLSELSADKLPVCLINNGFFTAAGVAFSDDELQNFQNPDDLRPKRWFKATRTSLRKVSPLEEYEGLA